VGEKLDQVERQRKVRLLSDGAWGVKKKEATRRKRKRESSWETAEGDDGKKSTAPQTGMKIHFLTFREEGKWKRKEEERG